MRGPRLDCSYDKLLWINRGSNTPPTHNQANPYSLFTYDADGRTTYRERQFDGGWHHDFAFSWDGDDRLRSVTNGSTSWLSALYDGGGTRVSKTDPFTGTHNYSFGPGGIISDSAGSTTYTPGFAHRQGTTDRFYHSDWLSSTRYLTDGSGNAETVGMRYDAFGNRTATGGTDPYDASEFQFAGGAGYQSEYASYTEVGIGLQYLNERYYDPAIGRFISPDPLGGANLYDYCGNNPVGMIDPSGMDPSFASTWLQYVGESYASEGQMIAEGWGRAFQWAMTKLDNAGPGLMDLATRGFKMQPGIQTLQTANRDAYPMLPEAGRQMKAGFRHAVGIIGSQAIMGAAGLSGEGELGETCEEGPSIHWGQQGKHIPGRNLLPGRSILTDTDPQALLGEFSGRGEALNDTPIGMPGSRERVNFGKEIGWFVDQPKGGVAYPTTNGIIHYSKLGAHIVPARP